MHESNLAVIGSLIASHREYFLNTFSLRLVVLFLVIRSFILRSVASNHHASRIFMGIIQLTIFNVFIFRNIFIYFNTLRIFTTPFFLLLFMCAG